MSLFRKLHTDEIPVVPDDAEERHNAIARNRQKLSKAFELIPRTKLVVDSLNAHQEINHYALRLNEAYGGEKK
jgi:hypothetical protein